MSAEVIVVGSGASAVHAAAALVEAGRRVLVIDAGIRDERYAPLVPDASFSELRRTDPEQHRYLLGDRFEGVPFGGVRVGAQLTPPRAFITERVDELTPSNAVGFGGMESLSRGGLGSGWGAGVARFSAEDLAGMPLGPGDLAPSYAAVERRIGVSGEDDDLTAELGLHEGMMPALPLDTQGEVLLARYRRSAASFHREGLRLGIARVAACSRPHRGRGPHRADDLDFWADKGRAVYRPAFTLDELEAQEGFAYLPGRLVLSFHEGASSVKIRARRLDGGPDEEHEARALVIAAGTFGTARIVLRSLGLHGRPVPYVCNPYTYVPCLDVGMIGREARDPRHSLVQLAATFRPPGGSWPAMHASIYSYRSLLTFKLMKEAPLSARAAREVMRSLTPLFAIFGLHHADAPSPRKTATLLPAQGSAPEQLAIAHALSPDEQARIDRQEALFLRQARRLGCVPIKRVRPGPGASIHYGGTFPMAEAPGELCCDRDGRLGGTRAVHLADGSLLPRLPAKGLTLTLMALAHHVGASLAPRL